MNSIIYKQTDSRWAKKAYPSGSTVGGCGCGLLACTHIAMEQQSKRNWTPDNLRSWMVGKGFAVRGQGTRWEGITETLKYIGHKSVVRVYSDPMTVAWKELNKGNRIGVLLFNSHTAPNGVKWTASGHYVAFTGYKYQNGKHYFYTKDSGGRNHSGWYSYENSMKGCIAKLWIVERVGTETKSSATTTPKAVTADGKLVADGVGGSATVKAMQRFFGTSPQDGVISGQNQSYAKYHPALKSVKYGKGGSVCVKYLQKWLGITQDGIWGKGTSVALQKKLGVTADGIFGSGSMKAWQKYLNEHDKAVYPTVKKTIVDKELEACKTQSVWMKNATYKWESNPTIAKSKKKGTCVTYVACVLQRIGVLKSGEFVWQNGKGYGTGKVYGNNSKMTVTYMGNKTISSLKSKLKVGDIVLLDDNKSGNRGGGGHIFILAGWSGSTPLVWDNETAKKGQKARTYSGSRKVLAVVRLK